MLEQEKESMGIDVSFLDAELPVKGALWKCSGAMAHNYLLWCVIGCDLPKGSDSMDMSEQILGERGGQGSSLCCSSGVTKSQTRLSD